MNTDHSAPMGTKARELNCKAKAAIDAPFLTQMKDLKATLLDATDLLVEMADRIDANTPYTDEG